MIIPFHAPLPVSSDQAVNALADREFLSKCIDGALLERAVGDELLRGTFSFVNNDFETTYQFGVRLVDFDADGRSLTYEASARQIDGQGLAALVVEIDVNIDGSTSQLVMNSRVEMAGMNTNSSCSQLERVVADKLADFGAGIVAELGKDTGRAWQAPGTGTRAVPAPVGANAASVKTSVASRVRLTLLPLGAVGGASAIAYLIWRAVRARASKGAAS